MLSANDQRLRATQTAHKGIQYLLNAGVSFKCTAKAYATEAVQLVLEHDDIEDAQDLLVSLHMMLGKDEATQRHGPASI